MSLNQNFILSDSSNQNSKTLVKTTNFSSDKLSLKPYQKILHKTQFAKIFSTKDAFKFSNKFFQILAIKNELNFARVGTIASKKQLKRAHERNRAKRLIREQFRLDQYNFVNIDFIVIPRKAFEQSENAELVTQLNKAFSIMNKFFKGRD